MQCQIQVGALKQRNNPSVVVLDEALIKALLQIQPFCGKVDIIHSITQELNINCIVPFDGTIVFCNSPSFMWVLIMSNL